MKLALSLSKGALVASAVISVSCGAPLMKLPTGPGKPADDAASVMAQATAVCRAVNTITLEMSVHGSAGGHRVRGRLTAGLAKPSSARLEAAASFGQPLFIFVASGADASLLLPRDKRILERGRPADVLEAVSGVPLDAAALRTLVTGCANMPDASDAVSFGDNWRVAPDGMDDVYFRRDPSTRPDGARSGQDAASWRLVSTVRRAAWRAEYSMFLNNLPRIVRIVSAPSDRFDLQLDLSQVDVNVPLGPEAFRLQQAAGADPISLEELRRSGPLGDK